MKLISLLDKLKARVGVLDADQLIKLFSELEIDSHKMEFDENEIRLPSASVKDIAILKEKLKSASKTGRAFEVTLD